MPVLDSDLQAGRDLYEVNVFGVIAVTQAFFPLLRESKGMVANVGSIVGTGPMAPYQGVHYISPNRVSCPGHLLTSRTRQSSMPLPRPLCTPLEIPCATSLHHSTSKL